MRKAKVGFSSTPGRPVKFARSPTTFCGGVWFTQMWTRFIFSHRFSQTRASWRDMSAFSQERAAEMGCGRIHPPPKETFTQPQDIWIMRIIGLPGESLELRDDRVYIGGKRAAQPERLATIRYVANIRRSPKPYGCIKEFQRLN